MCTIYSIEGDGLVNKKQCTITMTTCMIRLESDLHRASEHGEAFCWLRLWFSLLVLEERPALHTQQREEAKCQRHY